MRAVDFLLCMAEVGKEKRKKASKKERKKRECKQISQQLF